MRIVVLGAGVLLAGCVQQAYIPPQPIDLQPYPPPIPYRYDPSLRGPTAAPAAEPLPPPNALVEPPAATDQPPSDEGAIPLQQMPAPAPETPAAPQPDTAAQPATPTPATPATPTAGRGSNVPLEGFRPMHSQTRPAP